MVILGLDISTKTGFAILKDGKLIQKGLLKVAATNEYASLDINQLIRAEAVASGIAKVILASKPDLICVEQTNGGKNRSSQKQLEFIHCLFLQWAVRNEVAGRVQYVDTSRWRSTLKVTLSKEDRQHNKLVKQKLARGKITTKHIAVRWVNKEYGLNLILKDNDIADAICLASYGDKKTNSVVANKSLDDALFK